MSTVIILSCILLSCIILIIFLLRKINAAQNHITDISTELASTKSRAEEMTKRTAEAIQDTLISRKENNSLREENSCLRERIRFIEEEKKKIAQDSELRFQNIANEILTTNSRIFKEQNESRLNEILAPLKENIEQFKRTICENYSTESKERFSLQEKIKELIELNQTIGREAKELTLALKGNSKVQGDWGEMILENILEKSGLQKDREYEVQPTKDSNGKILRDENGNALRPDVVVYYPGGKYVVIDSKVSLSAYISYINTDNSDEQNEYAKQHLSSIRKHISELRDRKYQDYIGEGKTDFVMMFIPNEAAYITAMQLDAKLWQDAYDARVLLVSPTQLISALRLISQLWSHDRQTRNAIEIANVGGKMYDKLAGFIKDMNTIEQKINQAHDAYTEAMKKLSEGKGNLLSHAEKMQALGAKAKKTLVDDK